MVLIGNPECNPQKLVNLDWRVRKKRDKQDLWSRLAALLPTLKVTRRGKRHSYFSSTCLAPMRCAVAKASASLPRRQGPHNASAIGSTIKV
ncbi:hypothetical protein BaRGS_00003711 [Batillaria attramentaria]|uniref:Uncharacterized protein n=1 Tax=Batillaria attramentaria TaxID=370345 RepID=A0ABD0M1E9_9CAEN